MSAIDRAFDNFFAYDFGPLDAANGASSRYYHVREETEAQVAKIVAPLKRRASEIMRPHSIRWSSGSDFSIGVDPMPALTGSIMPGAVHYIRANGFYGNWPTIDFSCIVKTPDEFAAFWRAMRSTADALAASEIFKATGDAS